jgi:flagellar biosynthesis chaperone FliJ
MNSRSQRVDRLLALRERALEATRLALGAATTAAAAAARAQDAAQVAWAQRAEAFAAAAFATVDLLEEAHAHVGSLRRRADLAGEALAAARASEDECRAACARAERERRKLELWRERLAEIDRAAERRLERMTTDEAAARTFARGPG